MLPKLSQCTARFVYVLSPTVLHQLKCNLYHVNLCYRSFKMRYNMTYRMQTAIAPMTVKDRITKHLDSFGSHCISPTIQSRKKISQVLLYFYILNSIKQANLLIKVPDLLFYFTFYIILSRNIVLILHKRSGGHYLTSIRLNSI